MSGFAERYGPWALVVGASAGLGAAFVRALVTRGLKVMAVARSIEQLERLREECARERDELVRVLPLDLLADDAPGRLLSAMRDIDTGLFIYNIGFPNGGQFLDRPLETLRAQVRLNSTLPLELAHHFASRMVRRKRGGIVLSTSLTSLVGSPDTAAYGASKSFNMILAEGLWYELAAGGVDVLACCSGVIRPDRGEPPLPFPARLLSMNPRSIAEAALRALPRGGVVIPGLLNQVVAFGLQRLLPRAFSVRLMAATIRRLDIAARQRRQHIG